jgi:hypothetical protein
MNNQSQSEYCLIVEGSYFTEDEVQKALRDPFIDEWIEETGNFRINNFDHIEVASGVSLGSLAVKMLEDEIFQITCRKPFSQEKAKKVADAIRRQDMFDEVYVEQLET